MYPSRQLRALALNREALRRQIELRRDRCADLGGEVEAKFARWMKWGRLVRAGLWGVACVGLLRRGSAGSDPKEEPFSPAAGRWLRWAPLAWRAARLVAGW